VIILSLKKFYIFCVFFLVLVAKVNAVEPKLRCESFTNIDDEIKILDDSLRVNSKEYLIVNQSSASGWVFGSYLFIGEFEDQYILASIANQLPLKKKAITKQYFDELVETAVKVLSEKKVTSVKSNCDFCHQIIVKKADVNKNEIVFGMFQSDSNLTKFNRKLESLLFDR
jgi:hypothetical protein